MDAGGRGSRVGAVERAKLLALLLLFHLEALYQDHGLQKSFDLDFDFVEVEAVFVAVLVLLVPLIFLPNLVEHLWEPQIPQNLDYLLLPGLTLAVVYILVH